MGPGAGGPEVEPGVGSEGGPQVGPRQGLE
jgi:hypothetical protein